VSRNPALILIYIWLAVFLAYVGWLFYVAYIRDRGKW
jgi:hypothetical protein